MHANPVIRRFLVLKYPPIEEFLNKILEENKPVSDNKNIEESCQESLWEIADLIIYNKHPEVYDTQVEFKWSLEDITSVTPLEGKVVIDAGAGTGRLSFLAAKHAGIVYALEPVASLRAFIRKKTINQNIKNLYIIDGFLDSIPLPDDSADVLLTSNAIGWNLEDELKEIERVLKPAAHAIHLIQTDAQFENPLHDHLVSSVWNYSFRETRDNGNLKLKYFKKLT
jgi:ubiquinone/menaquinone biosynthesis C-methylase UbiE